jgi:hypothetical protein
MGNMSDADYTAAEAATAAMDFTAAQITGTNSALTTTMANAMAASGGFGAGGREYQIGMVSDRVRRKITKWEELKVLAAAATADEVIQMRSKWLDGSRVPGYLVFVEILGNSNGKLSLQTSMGEEGPWKEVAAYTGTTATTVLVSSEGDAALLAGMLRWKMTGTAADWKVCFRLQATPTTRRS